jgi:hypothetical protein
VDVVFEVAGQPYPLDERAATLMAENLRVKAAHEPGAEGAEGARPVADEDPGVRLLWATSRRDDGKKYLQNSTL